MVSDVVLEVKNISSTNLIFFQLYKEVTKYSLFRIYTVNKSNLIKKEVSPVKVASLLKKGSNFNFLMVVLSSFDSKY